MKAVVFAYHNMGLAGLDALMRHGFDLPAILSHEDDPGENCWFGSVADWAKEHSLPVFTPENINTEEWISRIRGWRPDVLFSFYYRNLICQQILDIPPCDAFNLHGSLLPAYRGRVPVNWALIHGEIKTGVTLHYMVKKADAGDIVGQREVAIDFEDTALRLYGKLCGAATLLLDETLPLILAGRTPRRCQDESRATTFKGRRPEDGRIDWTWTAMRIYNLIRAVTEPYPGAFTHLPGAEKMTIWWGLPEAGHAAPVRSGEVRVHGENVLVGTGEGALRLLDVQVGDGRFRDDRLIDYFREREGIVLL